MGFFGNFRFHVIKKGWLKLPVSDIQCSIVGPLSFSAEFSSILPQFQANSSKSLPSCSTYHFNRGWRPGEGTARFDQNRFKKSNHRSICASVSESATLESQILQTYFASLKESVCLRNATLHWIDFQKYFFLALLCGYNGSVINTLKKIFSSLQLTNIAAHQ